MNVHTPGPWRAESGCIYSVAHERDYSTNPKDAPYIWRVCEGLHGKSMEEIEANARLIAAAPDLLAALHDCVERYAISANCICDWSQDRQGAHESHCPIYTVTVARAAIAKAVQS